MKYFGIRRVLVGGMCAVLVLAAPVSVLAFASSESAALMVDVLSGGGNTASSESVVLSSTCGQSTPAGESSSESYTLQTGFWYAMAPLMDSDGDGITNATDPDDDNDGLTDVEEATLGTNPLAADSDDDGVNDPVDFFPNDATETVDSDSDGIGDNSDPDDDNDGVPDAADAFPFDAAESVDTDGDGIGNNADIDDDNDGVSDAADAFPLDAAESVDTDGDGIGNNADIDDDNDGVADTSDAFPLDPVESVDSDGDGIGNNADSDDDNDGMPDVSDGCPLDPTETVDTDGDGIGNNADTDDDNDGLTDVMETTFLGSDPLSADSDGDGLDDGYEVNILGSSPVASDSDGDGIDDFIESSGGQLVDTDGDGQADCLDTDSDSDGLSDAAEVSVGSSPILADSDGDGINDGDDPYPLGKDSWAEPVTTGYVATFFGSVTIDGVAAELGDEIAVFDGDGMLCGRALVESGGLYNALNVVGDDLATAEDEGAVAGERLIFRLRDASEGQELRTATIVSSVPTTVTWEEGATSQVALEGFANIQVRLQLSVGWNLVSVPVAKTWHADNEPSIGLADQSSLQQLASIGEVFSSIAGKFSLIRSFDNNGAHTYDPALPDFFNNLGYVSGGYGYWIKMNMPAELRLTGPPMLETDGLQLKAGWNLVGYWGDDVRYVGSEPSDKFPAGTTFTQVSSIGDIVASLGSNLQLVRSFDREGAHTYDPALPDFFNNLKYMGPGYSYWIKVGADSVLDFASSGPPPGGGEDPNGGGAPEL